MPSTPLRMGAMRISFVIALGLAVLKLVADTLLPLMRDMSQPMHLPTGMDIVVFMAFWTVYLQLHNNSEAPYRLAALVVIAANMLLWLVLEPGWRDGLGEWVLLFDGLQIAATLWLFHGEPAKQPTQPADNLP